MAQQVYCDFDDDEPALLLVTSIGNGDVLAVCAGHVFPWAKTVAEQFGGMVPEPEKYSRQDIIDAVTARTLIASMMPGSKAVKDARINEIQALGELIILGPPPDEFGSTIEGPDSDVDEEEMMGHPVKPGPEMTEDEAKAISTPPAPAPEFTEAEKAALAEQESEDLLPVE